MTKNTSLDKEMASILIPQIAYIDVWDQLSASFEYSYVTRISQISKQKHSKFLNSKKLKLVTASINWRGMFTYSNRVISLYPNPLFLKIAQEPV